jgi:predicted AAA+ superfamily ATPase
VYVERGIKERFDRLAKTGDMIALVGPRQSGKTTFLQHQMVRADATYVLFDRPLPRRVFEEDVEKFEMEFVSGHELAVLDEVQYCEGAGRNLKYLVDNGNWLWITSSSERVLAREVLSHLVGRVHVMRLLPFDMDEYMRARGHKVRDGAILERAVWEHMLYGGYPQVVLTDDVRTKRDLLESLFETMVLKDVALTFSIDKVTELDRLIRYLSLTPGGPLNVQSLCDNLDLSAPSLEKYLDALEKSYMIFRVPPFFTNKLKEIVKQPKVFFVDTGLRNSIAGDVPSEPTGHMFENYVFSELMKLGHRPKYWRSRGGAEVDFVVETGGEVIPIEAKLKVAPGRVGRGLSSFISTYGPSRALVVGYRVERGSMRSKGARVEFTDVAGMRGALGPGRQ